MAEETQPGTESSMAEERKSEYTEAERGEVRKQLPWLFKQKWLSVVFLVVVLVYVLMALGEKLLPVAERIASGTAALLGRPRGLDGGAPDVV